MSGRKRMSGFPSLLSVEDARKLVLERLSLKLDREEVDIKNALGRVVCEDIRAGFDVPPFDRSAVEGYALIASDTTSAAPTNPVEFELIGRSEAGTRPQELPYVMPLKCVEVFTGGPIPKGADAVVMVEHTKKVEDKVLVFKPVAPWQNVSRKGEDFRAGEVIVRKGTKLRPWHIGALASVNITKLPVYRKLKIAVLSTGSELKEPGDQVEEGEILNSSKPMLKALVEDRGCVAIDLGTVPDEIEKIKKEITKGLETADMVLTTGGTSLGEKDLVPEAVAELGEPGVVVHGVSMRPGKPTGIGFVKGKPIFMLSGYPVAALVGFEVFVDPVISFLLGTHYEEARKVKGRLCRKLAKPVGVKSYVRVKVTKAGDEYLVEPLRLTGSGILSTMTRANGILEVEEDVEGYDEGDEVEVKLIQPIEEVG